MVDILRVGAGREPQLSRRDVSAAQDAEAVEHVVVVLSLDRVGAVEDSFAVRVERRGSGPSGVRLVRSRVVGFAEGDDKLVEVVEFQARGRFVEGSRIWQVGEVTAAPGLVDVEKAYLELVD